MIDTAVSPQTSALAQVFVPSARMPVLFVGHGSPMNAIEHNVWRQTWQDLGQELLARAGPATHPVHFGALAHARWLVADGHGRAAHHP